MGLIGLSTTGCQTESQAPEPESDASTVPGFVEVAQEVGLGGFRHERGDAGNLWFPEINGSGAAFIDFDGDGWQDILLAGGGTWPTSGLPPAEGVWLYRNNGDGTFELATHRAGLSGIREYTYGFAVADYDNDGDDDFYLTTVTSNRLFRNEGGRFTDVSRMSGTAGPDEWSTSAAFVDVDRDGALDLVVANYVEWSPQTDIPCLFGSDNRKDYCTPLAYRGLPPRFYRNVGNGRFEDRSTDSGLTHSPGKSMSLAVLDFNQDGWPDIAISNDGERDQLFRNRGDGTFEDVGLVTGMALNSRGQPTAGMGIDAGDIDGSGLDAILVGNFAGESMSLFQFDGRALFLDRARTSGLGAPSIPTLTFAVLLLDVDLDGDQDLYAANGHISLFAHLDDKPFGLAQPPHLFINRGGGIFQDVAPSTSALQETMIGRGVAAADYDRDGDVDLLVTENDGRVRLLKNLTRDGEDPPHFVRVELTGTTSNRDALGAEVILYHAGRTQRRYVRGGSSYLSQSERALTFGLGDADLVDSLVVKWPSGVRQVLTGVTPNRKVEVLETPAPTGNLTLRNGV